MDIQGRPLEITDGRGNEAGRQTYDMLGRVLVGWSADGGARTMLYAVGGQPVHQWDQRGRRRRYVYALRRPRLEAVRSGTGPEAVRSLLMYGDTLSPAPAAGLNLLGQIHKTFDASGVTTVDAYDRDGQPVSGQTQLRQTPAGADAPSVWSAFAAGADWSAEAHAQGLSVEQPTAPAPVLEAEVFTTRGRFDALGRPLGSVSPDGRETPYGYDEGGLLDTVGVADTAAASTAQSFVDGVRYDAQGRRTAIQLGNGTTTSYQYDADSRRLTLLSSAKSNQTDLQKLRYRYDAGGNIISIVDETQAPIWNNGILVSSERKFTYDARHRLVNATGRCHPGQQPSGELPPSRAIPHANDASSMVRYAESYAYDAVGNILEMHQTRGGTVAWRRRYQYAVDSNRLV